MVEMNHKGHAYLMVGLLAVGAALVLTDAVDGGLLFMVWPFACLVMMVFMVRSMGGRNTAAQDTPDDKVTHSHDDAATDPQR